MNLIEFLAAIQIVYWVMIYPTIRRWDQEDENE